MGDLGKVGQRSWTERGLLVEALAALLLAGALVRVVPFNRLAGWLGLRPGEGPTAALACPAESAGRVGWAVVAVGRRTAGFSTCLAQALAGAAMLRRRGLPATVYLGMARDGMAGYQAHAWLRSGDSILSGRHDGRFAPVAAFTMPGRRSPRSPTANH